MIQCEVQFRPRDWRIGVYVEPGSHADEVLFLVIQPLPMVRVWIGCYRRQEAQAEGQ